MSTRSTITIQHADNTCESIYCHWDGYLSWNGQLLYTFYNTAEKVQELINHGDASSLGMNIGERIDGKALDDPKRVTNFQCSFYSRDRGEKLQITHTDSVKKVNAEDYNYVFNEEKGVWSVSEDGMAKPKLLKTALVEDLIHNILIHKMTYESNDGNGNYFFTPDGTFNIPSDDYHSHEQIALKDIATPEQLDRLKAVTEEITKAANAKLARMEKNKKERDV